MNGPMMRTKAIARRINIFLVMIYWISIGVDQLERADRGCYIYTTKSIIHIHSTVHIWFISYSWINSYSAMN